MFHYVLSGLACVVGPLAGRFPTLVRAWLYCAGHSALQPRELRPHALANPTRIDHPLCPDTLPSLTVGRHHEGPPISSSRTWRLLSLAPLSLSAKSRSNITTVDEKIWHRLIRHLRSHGSAHERGVALLHSSSTIVATRQFEGCQKRSALRDGVLDKDTLFTNDLESTYQKRPGQGAELLAKPRSSSRRPTRTANTSRRLRLLL